MAAHPSVYVHIGLHKTGTTYLQNICRANRARLRTQGIDFPGGVGEPSQVLAVWDLQGRRPRGSDDHRIAGMWDALVHRVNNSPLPKVLISEERFSLCSARQSHKVMDAFGDGVEIIVTARDIGRVLVSAWQEEVKNESRLTWREYADAIIDPALATHGHTLGASGFARILRGSARSGRTWSPLAGYTSSLSLPPDRRARYYWRGMPQ